MTKDELEYVQDVARLAAMEMTMKILGAIRDIGLLAYRHVKTRLPEMIADRKIMSEGEFLAKYAKLLEELQPEAKRIVEEAIGPLAPPPDRTVF